MHRLAAATQRRRQIAPTSTMCFERGGKHFTNARPLAKARATERYSHRGNLDVLVNFRVGTLVAEIVLLQVLVNGWGGGPISDHPLPLSPWTSIDI